MDISVYKFPHLVEEERSKVEEFYCELANKYRDGEILDPEIIDWMDTANNWLMISERK